MNVLGTIFDVSDITIFMPNSQKALTSFDAISARNSSQQALADIFNYHTLSNFVAYSHLLTNGLRLKTSEGQSIKVTIEGNDTFIDGALIISSDFLIGNGVMHILNE